MLADVQIEQPGAELGFGERLVAIVEELPAFLGVARVAVELDELLELLGGELRGPFQPGRGGPGGWWLLFEPELHLLALEPMVPCLAGWRVERMSTLPETTYFTLAPDWICEVLSKSTEIVDRNKKLPIYAAHGVSHVWLIDPIAKTLEVHSLGDDRRWRDVRIYEGEARVRAEPFAAIELDLASLWVR